MGTLIKSISTLKFIVEVKGYRLMSMILIMVDLVLFISIFNDLLSGELSAPIIGSLGLGYITGYNIGLYMEKKIALGKVSVNIKIRKKDSEYLRKELKKNGFIFIKSDENYSHKGKKRVLFNGVIFRKELPKLRGIINKMDLIATVYEVKEVCGKKVIPSKEYLRLQSTEIKEI
ncbi:MAG: hypothetical protein ACOCP4_00090 [Candidatus Woesearchaeota archaeon]